MTTHYPKAEAGDAEAQYVLGEAYRIGEGVEQDNAEAVRWYRKAAEQGHAKAQSKLGYTYYHGEGLEQDYMEAVSWWRKAAEQGHVAAQFNLGAAYEAGKGVEQDYVEAVSWYTLSGAGNLSEEILDRLYQALGRLSGRMTPAQCGGARWLFSLRHAEIQSRKVQQEFDPERFLLASLLAEIEDRKEQNEGAGEITAHLGEILAVVEDYIPPGQIARVLEFHMEIEARQARNE